MSEPIDTARFVRGRVEYNTEAETRLITADHARREAVSRTDVDSGFHDATPVVAGTYPHRGSGAWIVPWRP